MNSLGKAALNSSLNSSGVKLASSSQSGINWNDFNYPPLLKIIHFDRGELTDPHIGVATKLQLCQLTIIFISFLNIINNIVQVAADSASGLRIVYSILFIILMNPIAGFCFYRGIYGFLEDSSQFLKFYVLSGVLAGSYIAFSIGTFLNFNGFLRIKNVSTFPAIVCVIESITFLLTSLLHGFMIYKAFKWEHGPANVRQNKERTLSNSSNSSAV